MRAALLGMRWHVWAQRGEQQTDESWRQRSKQVTPPTMAEVQIATATKETLAILPPLPAFTLHLFNPHGRHKLAVLPVLGCLWCSLYSPSWTCSVAKCHFTLKSDRPSFSALSNAPAPPRCSPPSTLNTQTIGSVTPVSLFFFVFEVRLSPSMFSFYCFHRKRSVCAVDCWRDGTFFSFSIYSPSHIILAWILLGVFIAKGPSCDLCLLVGHVCLIYCLLNDECKIQFVYWFTFKWEWSMQFKKKTWTLKTYFHSSRTVLKSFSPVHWRCLMTWNSWI